MKLDSRYISRPGIYCLLVGIVLVAFFELWRLILLAIVDDGAANVPVAILAKSFLVGVRFDILIASFIMMPLSLLAVIPLVDIARNRTVRFVHTIILSLCAAGAFSLHLADIEFFDFFNVRLNGIAGQWDDTPGMMIQMVWETYPVIGYLILYAVVLAAFIWVVRRLQRWLFRSFFISPFWVHLLYLLPLMVILFGGARGRITDKTVIRWGVAYFSEHEFANQLALNPVYTFLHDAVYSSDEKEDLRKFAEDISRPNAETTIRNLIGMSVDDPIVQNLRIHRRVVFDPPSGDPPNVILIIMESFGATKIDALDNIFNVPLSPCFDSLTKDGLLFTNMYSEGMHTYSGIFAPLFGYPHLLGKGLMKQVRGDYHLWGLPSILRAHNYETVFILPHDPHWDNIQGFMISNGFQRVVSALDFDEELHLGTWGVPDHVMFDRAIDEIDSLNGKRFFATMLTASNHGPWLVPDVPFQRVPPGTPDEDILNAFKYSDWALGRFIRTVQTDPAFANTIVVITSDNGAGGRKRIRMDPSRVHIPMLILDTRGNLPRDVRTDQLGSQMDILATIMGLVGLDYDDYSFGRDLLDSTSTVEPFAYLSEWYYLGFIQNGYYLVSPQRGRGSPRLYRLPDVTVNLADSLAEMTAEYNKRALSIFSVGYHNLLRPLIGADSAAVTAAGR